MFNLELGLPVKNLAKQKYPIKILIPNADFSYIESSVHNTNSALTPHLGPILGEDSSIGKHVYIAKAWPMQMLCICLYQHSFIWMTRSGVLGFSLKKFKNNLVMCRSVETFEVAYNFTFLGQSWKKYNWYWLTIK